MQATPTVCTRFSYLLGDAVGVAGAVDVHDLGDALSPVDVVHGVLVFHVGDVALVEQQDVRPRKQRLSEVRVPTRQRNLPKQTTLYSNSFQHF